MKALAMKDLHVLRATLKYYLFLIMVFTLAMRSAGSIFIILYTAMLPYTALAYDERAHFELQATAMPYSWRDLVLSKYILGWLGMIVSLPISIAIALLCQYLGWGPFYIEQQLSTLFSGVMLLAVCLPVMFRKGVEVGRVLNILMVLVVCTAAMMMFALLGEIIGNTVLLWLVVAAVAVAVSVASVRVSEKWYKKRIME